MSTELRDMTVTVQTTMDDHTETHMIANATSAVRANDFLIVCHKTDDGADEWLHWPMCIITHWGMRDNAAKEASR